MGRHWKEMTLDAVNAQAAETAKTSRSGSQYAHISRVGFSPDAQRFLVEAARARGISIAGYIRRATLAHVALDLGLKATDLFQLDNSVAPLGVGGPGRGRGIRDLDGDLWGRWEVKADEPDAG